MGANIRVSQTGGKAVYLNVGVWFDEKNENIHVTLSGTGKFHATVNDKEGSARRHTYIFRKLSKVLKDAGVPYPDYFDEQK